jgi:hypothetical protein
MWGSKGERVESTAIDGHAGVGAGQGVTQVDEGEAPEWKNCNDFMREFEGREGLVGRGG